MLSNDENSNYWFTKDRSETATNRYAERSIGNNILVENPALGINLYRNVFSKEDSRAYDENKICAWVEQNCGKQKSQSHLRQRNPPYWQRRLKHLPT
jgi:hypothetical protein